MTEAITILACLALFYAGLLAWAVAGRLGLRFLEAAHRRSMRARAMLRDMDTVFARNAEVYAANKEVYEAAMSCFEYNVKAVAAIELWNAGRQLEAMQAIEDLPAVPLQKARLH